MTLEFHWFIPSGGDSRELISTGPRGAARSYRAPGYDYLLQVARAAERAGFAGAMLPTTSASTEDSWTLAAALATDTERLQLLVSFVPGLELPASFARRVATLQQLAPGRLKLLMFSAGHSLEQRAQGDFLEHDERYERAGEFLQIARAVWRGGPVQHAGRHYLLNTPGLTVAACEAPPLYVGGASAAAERLAAAQADVRLLWGETPAMVRERIERLQRHGRRPGHALRVHVIARETEAEAWAQAERLLRAVPQSLIDAAQRQLANIDSVAQSRMLGLHRGTTVQDVRELEVSPNLWAGIGLVRGGAGTALVGSYAQVARRLEEYAALGIGSFILSGYPNLEEARVVGERVLPLVQAVSPADALQTA